MLSLYLNNDSLVKIIRDHRDEILDVRTSNLIVGMFNAAPDAANLSSIVAFYEANFGLICNICLAIMISEEHCEGEGGTGSAFFERI